jgi:hypothetical protein
MYLIYIEAVKRGGTGTEGQAIAYFNLLRTRAYGNASGNITSYTLNDVLDERGRELYWEGFRRSDLIRSAGSPVIITCGHGKAAQKQVKGWRTSGCFTRCHQQILLPIQIWYKTQVINILQIIKMKRNISKALFGALALLIIISGCKRDDILVKSSARHSACLNRYHEHYWCLAAIRQQPRPLLSTGTRPITATTQRCNTPCN